MATTPVAPPIEPKPGDVNLPPPDPAVQRLQQELQRKSAEVDALKRQVFAPPPNAAPAPGQPSDADKKAEERKFLQNPIDYSMAIADRVARNVTQQMQGASFETQVEMAKQLARGSGSDAELFDRFETEIVTMVTTQVEPQLRMNVEVWRNAFNQVKGKNLAAIIEHAKQPPKNDDNRSANVIIRPAGSPNLPSKAHPEGDTGAVKLTDEEKRWAKKLNLSEEQYAQGKKDNDGQSDFILDPLGKSSWDDYVTFDSREKRRKDRAAKIAGRAKS